MNSKATTSQSYSPRRIILSVGVVVLLAILMIALETFSPGSTLSAQELATDEPAVNFRVTGFTDTTAGVAWEVPRNRGITNYVLQRYDHNGSEFVLGRTIDGQVSGGGGVAWAHISLTPDTQYKYVLYLRDDQNTTVIEASVTVRTLTTGGSTVSNDATLSGLTLSGLDIGPFSSGKTYYTATAGHSVTETTVTASTNHAGASFQVQLGGAVDDDGVIPLAVGSNTIGVRVTAEDGVTTRIYTVIVTREGLFSTDAALSALSLSGVDFGTFDADTTQYTVRVLGVTETTVSATVNHSSASRVIKLNGAVDADGVIPLAVGNNVITVEVTAEDGSTNRTYTVTVTRVLSTNASLRDLSLSNVDFGVFSWHITRYTARVANGVTETTVTPALLHSVASYVIKLNGAVDADGVIPLAVGSNVITVEVTAEDGSATRTYTVTVIREAVTGELATDEPAVNFRVTGFTDTTAGVAWEVPRNRGITNYVLQRYDHNGSEFVLGRTIDGQVSGGGGVAWAHISLTPDTQYKYVLYLRDDQNTTVIEASVTVRTLTTGGSTVSNDATLSGLTLSGLDIGPFSSGKTYYTATAGHSVTETTVTASTNHAGASFQVQLGGAVDDDGVIPLAVGSNTIGVRVTAEDGVTTRIYTVIVTREGLFSTDAALSALSLSGVDFGTFDADTTQYTVRVLGVTETTVSATVNHSSASRVIKLNGAVDADGVIPLAVGNNVITVEVTAEDGSTNRTYTVTVTRVLSTNASLRDLSLSNVDFGVFSWHITRYTARVANGVTETTVTPALLHSVASYVIKLNGAVDADGVIPLAVGSNVITVEVTAEDGSATRTYTVTVIREAVTGELATDEPAVNFRVTGFTDTTAGVAWEVPRNRGITNYVLQRYDHNGSEFVLGRTIDGQVSGGGGVAWAHISLTPDTQYKYVLYLRDDQNTTVIEASVTVRTLTTGGSTVSNDATLSGLTLSGLDIGPFSSGKTYYTATAGHSVTETTVTASTNHAGASFQVQLGGAVDDDGVIPLAVGSNTIGVRVTAEDGVTTRIYTVIVTREGLFSTDAALSALSLSGVDFGTFDADTTQYTVRVLGVTETTVSATVNHSSASRVIKLNGAVDADGVIPLAVGNNVITVEVTAEDGSTNRTYTVTVTRVLSTNASLRDLSLSNVDFGVFSWHITRYTARVANGVTETTVTPALLHSVASYVIKLNGAVDADGVIPLAVGSNVITVEVTAEDGSATRTYTVTVIREAVTGELATDEPAVNFRVTGFTDTTAGVAWEVPRNRGITNYVLQRYDHNGSEFVLGRTIDGQVSGGGSAAWAHISLTPDTQYKYVLYLRDDQNTTVIEASVTVRTLSADPLSAPTLTVEASGSTVDLSWEAAAGAARYELSTWWDSEVGWQRLDDGNLTGTTYTHTDVTAGTTYFYAILSVGAGGEMSTWSDFESVTVPASEPGLSAPTLTAESAQGGVDLSWGEVAGAARYELWTWWDSEVGWQPLDDGNLTGTTYTHTDVTAGTTYFYAVRSVSAGGEMSTWSDFESVTVPASVPASEPGLSAPTLTAESAQGGVDLSWGEVAGAARYELWTWWDSEVGWQRLDDGNLTGTTYTHTDVTAGTTYYYSIRSLSAGGETSEWSEFVSSTVLASE